MKRPANPVSAVVEPVARVVSIVTGYGVLAFALLLSWEIVSRKLFGSAFKGIDELGGFVLAISAVVGASYSMALRGHTRVDVFLVRFPRPVQRVLNTLALVTLALSAIYAAWRGYAVLQDTLEFNSSSPNLDIPLAWPQMAWLAGLALFAVIAVAYSGHAIWLLVTGRTGINSFYGPLSVDEELEGELAAMKARSDDGGAA